MKVAIVSTKDWNESECMLPARHLNYTADDFNFMGGKSPSERWGMNAP